MALRRTAAPDDRRSVPYDEAIAGAAWEGRSPAAHGISVRVVAYVGAAEELPGVVPGGVTGVR